MARIGATLSGVERMLLNRLAESQAAVTLNNLHLATEKKINFPSDDPTAFLAISRFQTDLKVVTSAMANATAATSMVGKAQTTIGLIRTQLTAIRNILLTEDTPEKRAAAQVKIDNAIDQINQLAGADIDGRRLLDGSANFDISGRNPSQVSDVEVYAIPGDDHGAANPASVIAGTVLDVATQAQLTYTGSGGKATANATFTLTGDLGSAEIEVVLDQPLEGDGSVAEAINAQSHLTGVVATVAGNTLTLSSVHYGTAASVAVTDVVGTFVVSGGHGDGTANGTDAVAQINGLTYTGSGSRFTVNENGFRYAIEFAPGYEGNLSPISVSGEALAFALSTTVGRPSRLAIPGLQPNRLGGLSGTLNQIQSGGPYSGLDGNTSRAIRIVDEAIGDVDRVKGNVDGFYNAAITSSSELLADLETNLEDSIAQTDGFNQSEEELLLAKNEQLVYNGLAALTILGQQRTAMVQILQKIAGLI